MLKKQQKIARKAVRTRQARDTLLNEYGWFTYQIAMGDAPSLLGTRSVAAVWANINRPGRLHDLLKSCNF